MTMEAVVTEADVEALYQTVFGRAVGNDSYRREMVAHGVTVTQMLRVLLDSEEFAIRSRPQPGPDRPWFRVPQALEVTSLQPRRVLFAGSCLSEYWINALRDAGVKCDFELHMASALPERPALPMSEYDFQIVQLPLRSVLPDGAFARLGQRDLAGHERLFDHCADAVRMFLRAALRWNLEHGLLTFGLPFPVPQQNPIGRLLPRYDLRNPVYFIERLNEVLGRELESHSQAFLFDINAVVASAGAAGVQEDMIASFNHGSLLGLFEYFRDTGRLEPPGRADHHYASQTPAVLLTAWHELVAMLRSIRQTDMVKLVVLDLDDTLWRGVMAEAEADSMDDGEGWPRALWEALLILKRRGILLAIISKNEETVVRRMWDSILRGVLSLDDFAVTRINWQPKSQNMREILGLVNLGPQNVLFIDDNPANRAEVAQAFPGLRVLGGAPYAWRHILLWAAETQLAEVTVESAARTEMVRAQVAREDERTQLSPGEFLAALDVRMELIAIDSVTHPRFGRVLELVNKTNQYNTTGERWTREGFVAVLAAGRQIWAFDVADRYTHYGLVGVIALDGPLITQFVMSCRVMGLEVENAAVAAMVARGATRARLLHTERNLPCQDLYARCGFRAVGEVWVLADKPPMPTHVTLRVMEPALAE